MTRVTMSRECEQALAVLLKLAHLVDVTKLAEGRVETRVSFTDLSRVLELLQGVDLDRGLRLIPGLKGYDVSIWSRSATINYDPTILPMDFWRLFGKIRKDPSVEAVVRERLQSLFADNSGPKDKENSELLNRKTACSTEICE